MKLRNRRTSHQKIGRKICIQVIYKKVTEKMQAITGQFAAYQFYTSFLRLYYTLDLPPPLHRIQPPDQAGFRPNHRCDDHLMVYRVPEQRCLEWNVPLYISTIDFTNAFARIKQLSDLEISALLRYQTRIRETTATALQPASRNSSD